MGSLAIPFICAKAILAATTIAIANGSKAKIIISQSRCAINNPENLFSYFFQDCLTFDLIIFYNKSFIKFNIFKTKKLIPISNSEYKKDINIILNHCWI